MENVQISLSFTLHAASAVVYMYDFNVHFYNSKLIDKSFK